MRVAVVGSRSLTIDDLSPYLPEDTTEIITGGANGIDRSAQAWAQAHGIPVQVIRPEYTHYRRHAPLLRNEQIVRHADLVLAFWDGKSKGTAHTIALCRRNHVLYRLITPFSSAD